MRAKDIEHFSELLEAAELNAQTDWEMEFCADMTERYRKMDGETFVTDAQLAKLESIAG